MKVPKGYIDIMYGDCILRYPLPPKREWKKLIAEALKDKEKRACLFLR